TLSEAIWGKQLFQAIQERDDFWLVPHAEEAVTLEHDWLKERMRVVPYTLPLDVYQYQDTWGKAGPITPTIAVSCPNIANQYYKHAYRRINRDFPQDFIRMYGVQPRKVADPRIVGTVPRSRIVQDYQTCSGYLYVYQEPTVCYLPPIEVMTIGG